MLGLHGNWRNRALLDADNDIWYCMLYEAYLFELQLDVVQVVYVSDISAVVKRHVTAAAVTATTTTTEKEEEEDRRWTDESCQVPVDTCSWSYRAHLSSVCQHLSPLSRNILQVSTPMHGLCLAAAATVSATYIVGDPDWSHRRGQNSAQNCLNPFNAGCSKLLLFKGFGAILV